MCVCRLKLQSDRMTNMYAVCCNLWSSMTCCVAHVSWRLLLMLMSGTLTLILHVLPFLWTQLHSLLLVPYILRLHAHMLRMWRTSMTQGVACSSYNQWSKNHRLSCYAAPVCLAYLWHVLPLHTKSDVWAAHQVRSYQLQVIAVCLYVGGCASTTACTQHNSAACLTWLCMT